ncbi:MAG: MFS transporter [Planctomycetes bacterium]|nr:MFS transporter [Planctomycetota bacterium]
MAAWLCGLSSILYLDRICMAQAVKPIRDELGLSKSEMGYVLMAFTLAYGVFAVPAGRWGDKAGPRAVLAIIVLTWSGFTALTAVAAGLLTLLLVRFLFGAAEAGAFPNAAKVVSRWYPLPERGRVQGVMLAFAQIGAVVAPAATAYLIDAAGWRSVFLVYALIGCAWACGFWLWFRDDPARHPRVNAAELAAMRTSEAPPLADPGPVPWRAVLANRGIVVLCVVMILGAFYTYFFYGWLPTYLMEGRGVSNQLAGWLGSLVIAGSGVGMLVGGWLADRITRVSGDPIRDRRRLAVVCYILAAACLFAGTRCDDPLALAALWSASAGAMHVTLPNWWSVIIPQAGRHTATIFGLVNGMGCFGALASLGLIPEYADWRERSGVTGRAAWDPIFDVYVCVLLANAVAWYLYRFTPLPEPVEMPKESEG